MGLYLRYSSEQGGSAFGECDLAFANVILPPKILTKEGSTNLLTYTTDFSSDWTKINTSIIPNATYLNDGYTYANRIELTGGTGVLLQNFTPNDALTYTLSAYVKAGEVNIVNLVNCGTFVSFDLTSVLGSITSGTCTYSIVPVGMDWYRISSTVLVNAPEPVLYENGITFTGTSGDGIYLYGLQCEQSERISDYIPTYSLPVTRPDEYFQPMGIRQPGSDLESAVLISLLTWRRVTPDEAEPNSTRYGWWGDNLSNRPIGSKLWLLQRQKLLPNLKSKAKQYAEEALQWMVDDGVCSNIIVTPTITNEILSLNIQIIQNDGTVTRINYDDLWNELKK